MGVLAELARELGIEESYLIERLKTLFSEKPKRKNTPKIPKNDIELQTVENPTNEFIKFYCDEFKRVYRTHPTIDGKTAGLAKTLVKDLGLAKCQLLMLTYLKMRRRDFVLKHHDLVTFKFNLNAITVQANVGRSVDHFDAGNIALEDHNKNAIDAYLKEKACKTPS